MKKQPLLKPWSIRRRLTGRILVLVILSWAATIALAMLFLRYEIDEMLDEELQTMAETIVLSLDAAAVPAIPRSQAIGDHNGERILRIQRPNMPLPAAPWPEVVADGFHDVAGWRVLRLSAEGAVIEVAHSRAWRQEEILEVSVAFLPLFIPMLGLLIWGLRRSLNQGFTPLSLLTKTVAARPPSDLAPLAIQDLPTELKPLAEGLNSYLTRIKDLRQAERQFIANASHELRTPVAAIRARLELAGDPALSLIDNLTRRIERLLQLSRSEAGLGVLRGPADIVQIINMLIRETAKVNGHSIRFDDGDFEEMQIAADPDALAIVLRNLIENAQEHGTGTIAITLRSDSLAIQNPFWGEGFLEGAFHKSPRSSGMGLGLTIVEQLCQALGIKLIKHSQNGSATVRLIFKE